MKFILGTAEFGNIPYGYGAASVPSDDEIDKILNTPGINMIDTALSYSSHRHVARVPERIPVVTKVKKWEEFGECLKELKRPSVYGLLLHCDRQTEVPKCPNKLTYFAAQNLGVSVYTEQQLERVLSEKYELVQIPINLRENWAAPYISALRARGIEIHARSVFGRGLLLRSGYTTKECIEYIKRLNVDGIVIGVNNIKELQESLDILHKS